MTPVPEHLHDELERHIRDLQQAHQRSTRPFSTQHSSKKDLEKEHAEIDELVSLAQQLQSAPSLQVDPAFARRLEERLLARNTVLQQRRPTRARWNWSLFGLSRVRSAVVLALSLLLVVIGMGTGVLLAANQVGDPNNPLYTVKRWEQQMQISLASSSTDQVELHLQFARDQLTTLGNLTDASKSSSYQQALANFNQQVTTAAQEINALPAGPDHNRLAGELTILQTDARQMLRGLLGELTLSERLLTTDELGHLGDTIPSLTQVQVTLPAQPNGQALVSISGSNLQPGAQLLVNGQPVAANGSLQNGVYLFTVQWHGNEHPHSIGILNPDDTTAQTTQISIQTSNTGNGNGGGNGNGNGGGNGGGNDNGNGHGKTKPRL